jgi:hypothetical protein
VELRGLEPLHFPAKTRIELQGLLSRVVTSALAVQQICVGVLRDVTMLERVRAREVMRLHGWQRGAHGSVNSRRQRWASGFDARVKGVVGQRRLVEEAEVPEAPSGSHPLGVDEENTVDLKRIAWTATLAGAVGAAALGLGTGTPQAQPKQHAPGPVPSTTGFTQPPGHVGRNLGIAPGQFKKVPTITVALPDGSTVDIANPFQGIPPGHWHEHQADFDAAVAAASP